jgi:protein involved in polysaccharide export with SLBB domain
MFRRVSAIIALVVGALALGGCSSGNWDWAGLDRSVGLDILSPEEKYGTSPTHSAAKVAMHPADAAGTGAAPRQMGEVIEDRSPRPRAYALDTGDRLRVFVYGQPNLSRLYTVDQSGNISIPLIGNVRARNLTTQQLEGSIRTRLSQGLVRDPQVTVDVQQNRPFFILGEVRTPGQYPYVTGMTVEMAVAIAGGYGERANERKARLTRRNGGFTDVIDVPPDAELEPGDTLYVYERFF